MTEPYYQDDTVTLLHGDALASAKTLPDRSVQTIITSPPYFGLRDYGSDGQMGAEATVGEYVDGMVTLFHELHRTLADDGTLWLNLGDSYAASPGQRKVTNAAGAKQLTKRGSTGSPSRHVDGLPPKNLIGVPWRVALALQDDGWILRSDIIWAKPNPMPESVTDRPTKSHEYMFLFAKSPLYYYDAAAVAEPVTQSTRDRFAQDIDGQEGSTRGNGGAKTNGTMKAVGGTRFGGTKYGDDTSQESRTKSGNTYVAQPLRNRRTVWTVPTVPFGEAHFAVYPPELIRPCILAGSKPGDAVLDPFSGSGTTGMVATAEGRKYIGFDLNAEYLELSLRTRFAQPTLGIA